MKNLGFRVIYGKDKYDHYFGGQTWNVPICPQCNEPVHQIFTFDLTDPKLHDVREGKLLELPLVSCLNCSLYEEMQNFKLDIEKRRISIISQNEVFDWRYEEIDKISVPLPKSSMKLVDMEPYDVPCDENQYEQAFESIGTDYICRILGSPLNVEEPIDSKCPCCQKDMQYVVMIAGEDYGNEGNLTGGISFQIGESYIYFLLCKKCLILQTLTQSS
ncbi:hypothetical protein V7024_05350 [Bacillus sp. JJ864]|uniref:hypothetical protein n=1 Tax=Bacillus sp. JJ864 TaxID=3122975 RepID=UPI002FFEE3FA